MALVVFGPDDVWPNHQKPWWNEALDLARDYGWTYEYLDAPHKAGDIICPAGEHVLKVDKTSDGGSFYANEAKKTVTRKCSHGTRPGTGGKVKERIAAADGLLTSAERLISVAARDVSRLEAREEANSRLAELDDLEMRIGTADLTLSELEALQESALEDALVEVPAVEEVGADLDAADEDVATASSTLEKVRKHGSLEPLRDRAARARRQVDGLKARMAEFLPENP